MQRWCHLKPWGGTFGNLLHPFLPQTVSEYLLFVRICSGYYARYLVYSDELKGHGPIPMVLTALRLLKTGDSLLLDLLLKYELVD